MVAILRILPRPALKRRTASASEHISTSDSYHARTNPPPLGRRGPHSPHRPHGIKGHVAISPLSRLHLTSPGLQLRARNQNARSHWSKS
jgi:hypothetical protein